MFYKDLKNKQHINLPLADIDRSPWKNYFVFRFEDRPAPVRVGMFKYQDSMKFEPGTTIPCYIKEDESGEIQIVQDYKIVFSQLYKEGEIYNFIVKKDLTGDNPPVYFVTDDNGFQLNLPATGTGHLYKGQRIRCRVDKLKGCYIKLTLVENTGETSGLEMLTLDKLLSSIVHNEEERREVGGLKDLLFKTLAGNYCRNAVQAYKQKHREWVFLTICAIKDHLPEILSGQEPETVKKFIHYFRNTVLYLLEESDFISRLNDNERNEKQQILADTVRHIDAFTEATRLIACGSDAQFIDRLVNNLSNSGYLYEPERVFHILMYIFRLKPDLMDQKMQSLFDVITSKPLEMWKAEPFRSAFISQLQFYIGISRSGVDNLANVDNEADREKLDKIVTALAILRLLDDEQENKEFFVYTSMLYRYLTLYDSIDTENLFNLSYLALTGHTDKVCFSLIDCKSPFLLACKLNRKSLPAENEGTAMNYTGKNIQLNLSASQITLQPVQNKPTHNAIPGKLKLWKDIRVLSSESVSNGDISLTELHKQWLSVERSFLPDKPAVSARKPRYKILSLKEHVKVWVEEMLSPGAYSCRFVDNEYNERYEARLNINNIVRFNPMNDLSCFMDENTGRPFIYEAVVHNILDGKEKQVVDLDMLPVTDDWNNNDISFGDEVDCIISDVKPKAYICLDRYGLTLILHKDTCPDDLTKGTMVCVKSLGKEIYTQIQAEFVSLIDDEEPITKEEAFRNLMQYISEETLPEENEPEEDQNYVLQEDSLLSERQVEELTHIIDRKTVLMDDYRLSYHYLYIARLLAVMTGDTPLSDYFDNRLKLLEMLDNFAINHVVDTKRLKELENLKSKVALQSVMKLRIISSLDNQDSDEMLWDNVNGKSSDAEISSLSRLALAYNLLSGMGFSAQRQTIRKEIDKLLHFNTSEGIPSLGEESETIEFKTSLVYPPENHMMPNLQKQSENIMKVICAFLNTKGGTLYIGVSDNGMPVGIQNDLDYRLFNGKKDSYKVHLRNQINYYLHDIANSRVEEEWKTINGKDILVVNVKASPIPVLLNNIIYVRRGSTCQPLTEQKDIDDFRHSRAELAQKEEAEAQKLNPVSVSSTGKTVETAGTETTPKPFCQTGRQRNNVLHNFENNFIEPCKYLTLYPQGKYNVMERESWPEGSFTQIAIHEEDANGFLVLVYENGNALRVPMKEILEKNERDYVGNTEQKLVFASPATADEYLILILTDDKDCLYFRSVAVADIEKGSMRESGKAFTSLQSTVRYADIISSSQAKATDTYQRAITVYPTYIGILMKRQGNQAARIKNLLEEARLNFDEEELKRLTHNS